LILSGGFVVPAPEVSDIPQSSASGIPSAWKNWITSGGVGAAPTLHASTSSSPSIARDFDSTCSSACSHFSRTSAGSSSPACSARERWRPSSIAAFVGPRCSSGRFSTIASSPAFSFSQIRGTAKNQVGRTSGRYEITWRASGQQVTLKPHSIGR
jgi:hypothetical protein